MDESWRVEYHTYLWSRVKRKSYCEKKSVKRKKMLHRLPLSLNLFQSIFLIIFLSMISIFRDTIY